MLQSSSGSRTTRHARLAPGRRHGRRGYSGQPAQVPRNKGTGSHSAATLISTSQLTLRHGVRIIAASRRQAVHGCLRQTRRQAASDRTQAGTTAVYRSTPHLLRGPSQLEAHVLPWRCRRYPTVGTATDLAANNASGRRSALGQCRTCSAISPARTQSTPVNTQMAGVRRDSVMDKQHQAQPSAAIQLGRALAGHCRRLLGCSAGRQAQLMTKSWMPLARSPGRGVQQQLIDPQPLASSAGTSVQLMMMMSHQPLASS